MVFTEVFDALGQYPIDGRCVMLKKEYLYDSEQWYSDEDDWILYKGIVVAIAPYYKIDPSPDSVELYMCVDATNPGLDENDNYLPIPENHWRKISPSEIRWNDEIEPILSESEEPLENTDSLNSDDPNSGDQLE